MSTVGQYYVVVHQSDNYRSVHGPRHSEWVSDEVGALVDIFVDVPSWVHRDRIGARKRALVGWKTRAGAEQSRAWRDRVLEREQNADRFVYYPISICQLVEHPDESIELVPVLTLDAEGSFKENV